MDISRPFDKGSFDKATAMSTADLGYSESVSGSSSAISAHLCGRKEDMATRSLQNGQCFVV